MARSKFPLYVIYALIVAGLIVAIIFAFNSGTSPKPSSPGSKAGSNHQQTAGSNNPGTSGQARSQSGATNNQTAPKPNGGVAAGSNLSDTGPGDTLGLFAAVTAIGALSYRRYILARRT